MKLEGVGFEKEDLILKSLANALSNFHRRIIVFPEYENKNFLEVLNLILLNLSKFFSEIKILYVSDDIERDTPLIREIIKIGKKYQVEKIKKIELKETEKILGTTWNICIINMRESFTPDDLGRLLGLVEGGGFYFFLTPPFDEWEKKNLKYYEELITPPHRIEEIRKIFVKRIIKKLKEGDGVLIWPNIKEESSDLDVIIKEREKPLIPENISFDPKIYKLAYNQDQVNVLKMLEEFYNEKEKNTAIIIADRGRGKSAVVGLGLAGIADKMKKNKKRYVDIYVTAPNYENVRTLFEFAVLGLKKLGYEVKILDKAISAGSIRIDYVKPLQVLEKKADIVVIDEAAAIPIPFLQKIINKFDKTIFSSTIHGYEGAGRGFSVRFLNNLKKNKKIKTKIYEMKKPIRYEDNDPVEKWMFDALCLDAEPSKLDEKDLKEIEKLNVSINKPDLKEWFIGEKEKELREFVGIYILAHYRNRPNDLILLSDAPHHTARFLKTSKSIVNSIQLAYEGGLDLETASEMLKGYKPKGNVIPDTITKHYRTRKFALLRGWRIVRIATHPEVMRKGLGSKALELLEKEAEKENLDWIGAGFGVTEELLNFWMKNGYLPFHISPERNPVSGEYSIMVLKPISKKAKEIFEKILKEFKLKFISSILFVHFDLEPEIGVKMLKFGNFKYKKPYLTKTQERRFKAYLRGRMTYEAVPDVAYELARYYFLMSPNLLNNFEEKVVFMKCLQSKSWKKIKDHLKAKPVELYITLRDSFKKIWKWYNEAP